MPSLNPTGYETYVYDHRQWPISLDDDRQFCGPLHNPAELPAPEQHGDTTPFVMVEPSYASGSNDVFLMFRGNVHILPRKIAEQLRDALVKVCEKPLQ